MCGVFGAFTSTDFIDNAATLKHWSRYLLQLSESRGREAAGITFHSDTELLMYRQPIKSRHLANTTGYKQLFEHLSAQSTHSVGFIGHARLATHGTQLSSENNQPVESELLLGVHNGIIVNHQQLREKILKKPLYELDTMTLFELFDQFYKKFPSLDSTLKKVYKNIDGSATLAAYIKKQNKAFLSTNTGSLYFLEKPSKALVFASEKYILKRFKAEFANLFENVQILHIPPVQALILSLDNLSVSKINLTATPSKLTDTSEEHVRNIVDYSNQDQLNNKTDLILYQKKNNLKQIQKHNFDWKKINKLKRCKKCILPETMPFILFDERGVCNYCNQHKKIQYEGKKALEKLVEPYRKKNGEPDCIIAFSGGRDSSYGLHYLKKELGLNPIAYTYDWGMVTDLARRNQARMVGKLGVEHVIVSADITMKRHHINKHISAWVKKPDLGMVPLFMEGDKQCEFYADDLSDRMNLDLIFYCRGNELENEEFKWGHCGITDATPKGVIHNLSLKGKAQILSYYAWQYLSNPAYINESIFDTLLAFFSTYVQQHNYIYLWHYISWNEEQIISTLEENYGWERHPETKATWRTDDGTSAFYNYIYMTGQGFTENDTFRSNQIREGILTRKEALKLVEKENQPRHQALQWYFNMVGLDGNKVLTKVDNMPKRY